MSSRILFIGVGNDHRSDDRIGLVAARQVKEKCLPDAEVVEVAGGGAAILDVWERDDCVFLFDAAASGATPGTIHRFDATAETIPAGLFHHSTHDLGVVDAIELARAMDALPRRLIVYAIEAENFAAGSDITAEVEAAVDGMIDRVLADYHDLSSGD